MTSLSESLFQEVRPEFFRVLSGGLCRLYVDVLDAIESESARRCAGLDREEVLGVIGQVVEAWWVVGDSAAAAGEGLDSARTARERALAVFDVLRRSGWLLEEENRSDYRQVVHFESAGTVVLQALRRVARPEGAVFSDKLLLVCQTLARRDTLADQPWGQIESCIAALEAGLAELRTMQRSIERYTRRQLAAGTLRENLALIFDQFAERIGRNCYSQLVQARLPSRLAEARRTLDEMGQTGLLEQMQTEVLRREPGLAPETAMARVRLRVDELAQMLEQVEPLAEAVDRRTAEFARKSHARSRYLQETTSETRAAVQAFFETLNHHFSGRRLRDLEERVAGLPELRLADVRLAGGLETLQAPRVRREAVSGEPLEESDPLWQDRALAQLEGTLRDSLTVARANRFAQGLPGAAGEAVSSDRILSGAVHNDEDMASLIACLLHAQAPGARYRIVAGRASRDADRPVYDSKLGYRVERFTLIKQ